MLGDSLYTNPMMLGYAWQKGWIPLQRASLLRAIELNEVQVENNKTAFEWGRRAAHDAASVMSLLAPAQVIEFKPRETLDTLVQRRVEFLTGYQDAAYARAYEDFVRRVQQAEAAALPGRTALSETVARNLFKLMAYKDEYEVARLHTDPAFLRRITDMFEGDYKVHYHLAPPLVARRNAKGELVKRRYGPAMRTAFGLLARLKGLRGTALDIFGRSEERRTERALIGEYRATLEELLKSLSAANHAQALAIANLPDGIRGFGHVKERNLKAVRLQWSALMAAWRDPASVAAVSKAA
jgi:indolepyruvate ferredoxin oxidoreductase